MAEHHLAQSVRPVRHPAGALLDSFGEARTGRHRGRMGGYIKT